MNPTDGSNRGLKFRSPKFRSPKFRSPQFRFQKMSRMNPTYGSN